MVTRASTKSFSCPFTLHPKQKFRSTFERIRNETRLCPLLEEEKDVEASYFGPAVGPHGDSGMQGMELGAKYSHLDHIDRIMRQQTWERRFRFVGHTALLGLTIMVIYLALHHWALKK